MPQDTVTTSDATVQAITFHLPVPGTEILLRNTWSSLQDVAGKVAVAKQLAKP